MQRSFRKYSGLAAAAFLTLCAPVSSAPTPTVLKTQVLIGNYGPKWSFDIGAVSKGLYMLADRNSAALDVVDIKKSALAFQVTGFAGWGGVPKKSGPDGVVVIPGTSLVYAGDVGSVKVVDLDQKKIVKSIATTDTGFRTDEGCYDPDDKLVLFASPNDAVPNAAFISTTTQSVTGKIQFPQATDGLEACSYDPTTKSFYLSVPGTKTNEGGEIDVITAADATASQPKVSKVIPLEKCGPTGNVFGPTFGGKPQLLITCDSSDDKGAPIFALVMNVIDGSVLKIPQIGNADQVDYNPKTNKYFLAANKYWPSNQSGVGPKQGVVGVVDAGTATTPPTWIENLPTCTPVGPDGCNSVSHSVATDPVTGRTFVPVGSATVSAIYVFGQADTP
jgi:hypothetical protein